MNTRPGLEFDQAVALHRLDDSRWQAEIQDGWDFAGTPNGGYLLSMASPVFNCGIVLAWVPTVELTVHVHKRPAPGWLGEWFTTDHIAGGYLEEDGVIWDETGDVVAVSRQMAILPAERDPK